MKTEINQPIAVRVLFFGATRDSAGADEIKLEFAAPVALGAVKAKVFKAFPAIATLERSLLVAVNLEYAANDAVIGDLDEVAFFPPVSGG